MLYETLTPAYGRDYKTAKEALKAYQEGKDFILNAMGNRWDGKPITKAEAEAAGYKVILRFCKNRKTAVVRNS